MEIVLQNIPCHVPMVVVGEGLRVFEKRQNGVERR